MKSVLISINPRYCELIASGKKTIEVRKTKPKIDTPFKCYIYQTRCQQNEKYGLKEWARSGKVIGEFVCDKVITVDCDSISPFDRTTGFYINREICLERDIFIKYSHGYCTKGWHISDLVIYDKPRSLGEFKTAYCNIDCKECVLPSCANSLSKPPQSWCYVVAREGGEK